MTIVLDTGVFFRPQLIRALPAGELMVVPAIVLAERGSQLSLLGRPFHELRRFVAEAGLFVEDFGVEHAAALADRAPADPLWDRHARDVMIAAHVREDDVIWTTNPRDFLALGLRPEQVRGV